MLPQSNLSSVEVYFVSYGKHILHLVKVADIDPGDVLKVTRPAEERPARRFTARRSSPRSFPLLVYDVCRLCRFGFIPCSDDRSGRALACSALRLTP